MKASAHLMGIDSKTLYNWVNSDDPLLIPFKLQHQQALDAYAYFLGDAPHKGMPR